MGVDTVETGNEQKKLVKENEKKNKGAGHNEPIKFGTHASQKSSKEDGKKVPETNLRKDAVDDWPAPKQIHSFYIVRYRRLEDPKLKAKFDPAEQELQKMNKARSQLIENLRAVRAERSKMIEQRKAVSAENQEFWSVIGEKRKEMEPLQDALGKLRGPRKAGKEGGPSLCSSEEELDDLIKSLQYRIQHESIPLNEEKQILREIKRLEGTRGEVRELVAMRAQIQDSMGEKESIQKQFKAITGNLDGVRKEQQVVKAKLKQLDEKLDANTKQIKLLDEEMKEITKKRDRAFEHVQELRKQREEGNSPFYQYFALLQKAKLLADKKDVEALKELTLTEVDKFMSEWSGSKIFRDDYEKRILASLDIRQLSRDGRMRNPDEKPIVLPEARTVSQTEVVERNNAKPLKEESASTDQKVQKEKKSKEPTDASSKVAESTAQKYIFNIEEEIHGLDKKDMNPKKNDVDEAKLKQMKREEEIEKNKKAMERKKKLAEKAAAKAAIKAQKEAEKKLKEREKKAKKKAGGSVPDQESTEEPTETAPEAVEEENVDEKVETSVAPKVTKDTKDNTLRQRPKRAKGNDIARTILKRKKAMNYWLLAAPAAIVVPLLVAVAYKYLI